MIMHSQSKSKKTQNDRDAFSRFVSLIYKDESKSVSKNKSSSAVQNPCRPSPFNVLPNNANNSNRGTADPCSFLSHNVMVPPLTTKRANIENSYSRNWPIFTISAGIIHLSLRHGVRIDITVDNSIRLTSCAGQIVISLSNMGHSAAVKHPNGIVHQIGKSVQIIAHDQSMSSTHKRYANMCPNGISFTSSNLGEVFVLDAIGTRQCRKYFPKMTGDNTSTVFLGTSKHGSSCDDEASQLIQKVFFKKDTKGGMDVITINDYRIWQMKDGLVTVARMSFPFKIRASPMNCSFTLTTPDIHCTGSSKESPHLFVRCQDQSMHYDGNVFVVRYNGNSAGFDKNDFLIVY